MVISDLPSREPPPPATGGRRIDAKQVAVWTAVSLVAAVAWGVLALARGERISATWLVAGAVGSYAIGYRFYARFIVTRVLEVDESRATPAERLDNGIDRLHPRPTGASFSAITSRRSQAPGRSSGRCWPPRRATCLGRSGSSSAPSWLGPCGTWSRCSSRCAGRSYPTAWP